MCIRDSWKACMEFLLSVIELLFLSLAFEALQGKMCQKSLPSGGGRSLGAKISGRRGLPWGIFLVSAKLDTFCYPKCKLHRATCRRFDTIPACDGRTDRRNCRSYSTALAKRRAVKTEFHRHAQDGIAPQEIVHSAKFCTMHQIDLLQSTNENSILTGLSFRPRPRSRTDGNMACRCKGVRRRGDQFW